MGSSWAVGYLGLGWHPTHQPCSQASFPQSFQGIVGGQQGSQNGPGPDSEECPWDIN